MNPKNEACREGKRAYSRQNPRDVANIFASMDGDDSHQRDKQVAGRKRQAEIDPEDQRRHKTMKSQDNPMVDDIHDANNIPMNVWPDNSNTYQGMSIVVQSHNGTGWITRSNPLTTGGPKLLQIVAEILAKRSHTNEVLAYMVPLLSDETRTAFKSTDTCAMTDHELKLAIEETNFKIRNRCLRESFGQSTSDRDEAAADAAHETTCAGTGSEGEQDPGWLELLDFMELSKSRFLEDESALKFLRSLEPRIFDEGREYFSSEKLFLSFARMANIAKRRERFEECLVEAPREWYCFTAVCKNGYQYEAATANQKNCECPQNQMACLQVRIRRGKLGAFDVQFK